MLMFQISLPGAIEDPRENALESGNASGSRFKVSPVEQEVGLGKPTARLRQNSIVRRKSRCSILQRRLGSITGFMFSTSGTF